jgi:hypothetical protein
MKEPPKEPAKIKIVVKPSGGATVKKATIKEEPVDKQHQQKTAKKKSILRRIGEIVSNDIHNLPTKLWGAKKKVNMPKSDESFKDWEGQI